MRSRASQARALFRILSAQNASGSSAAASASATTSASTASSATAAASTATATHSTAFKRRASTSQTIETASTRLGRNNHRTIYIPSPTSQSSLPPQSVITGLQPVHPPPASLPGVAVQAFFATGRPLLEHQVVSSSSKGSSPQMMPSRESNEHLSAKDKSLIDNTRDAIMEAASQASRLSPEELSRTTFVVKLGESDHEGAWPEKVTKLNHDRFVKLVDRLSQSQTGLYAVQAEAKALEVEQAQKKDVESAVASAMERGEDPSVAKSLGSEADLVVLGEPSGPNPEWPRGVASYLVDKTRALEPPRAPADKAEEGVLTAVERVDLEDLVKHFAGSESAVTVQNVSEDNANMLLNHAMVQAILPSALQWDAVVAKMEAATSVDKTAPAQAVDWSIINADWEPMDNDGDEVHMDSVKRKRRKKMRKHKYRKFRKATRTERNRLKKG